MGCSYIHPMSYPISATNLPIVDDLYVLATDNVTADIVDGFFDEQTNVAFDDGEDDTLTLTLADLLAMCDPKSVES